MSEPERDPSDLELAALVDRWSALPEEQRTRVVQVPVFETLLAMRFGTKGIVGGRGAPGKVVTLERVIDERPCDPLLPEDCEHDEAPSLGSGATLYDGHSPPFMTGADDPQRPVTSL